MPTYVSETQPKVGSIEQFPTGCLVRYQNNCYRVRGWAVRNEETFLIVSSINEDPQTSNMELVDPENAEVVTIDEDLTRRSKELVRRLFNQKSHGSSVVGSLNLTHQEVELLCDSLVSLSQHAVSSLMAEPFTDIQSKSARAFAKVILFSLYSAR